MEDICNECGISVKRKYFTRHMQFTLCLKNIDETMLEKHLKTHQVIYKCEADECDKTYPSRKAYLDHNSAIHPPSIEKSCKLCRKVLASKNSHIHHMIAVHKSDDKSKGFINGMFISISDESSC